VSDNQGTAVYRRVTNPTTGQADGQTSLLSINSPHGVCLLPGKSPESGSSYAWISPYIARGLQFKRASLLSGRSLAVSLLVVCSCSGPQPVGDGLKGVHHQDNGSNVVFPEP